MTSASSAPKLDNTKDYIIVCDPSTKGHIVVDHVKIVGGHNVVMKGCFIQRKPGSAISAYPPVAGACAGINGYSVGTLTANGQTGVVYFEGIYVDVQNSTTNYQNYGVDAIDVGDSRGYSTLRLAGTATQGEKLALLFQNSALEALPSNPGFPRTIEVIVPASASLTSAAQAIVAAVTSDQAAIAKDAGQIRASAKGDVVTFEQDMPHGNRTLTSVSLGPGSQLSTTFNRADGAFRGVTYILQNVLTANTWSTPCGNHADGIQAQGDVNRLYLDRFTTVSGYQGVQLQPEFNLFDVRLSRVNTRYLDRDCTHLNAAGNTLGANGFGFWLGAGSNTVKFCETCAYSYQLDSVFAEERFGTVKANKIYCDGWADQSVSPPTSAPHGSSYVAGTTDEVEFDNSLPPETISGTVKKGAPSEGDYIPPSLIINKQGEVVYVPATEFQFASPAP